MGKSLDIPGIGAF